MKREIKFRAWDDEQNKMIKTFDGEYQILVNEECGTFFCGGYMSNGDWNEPKLMQYTGLKDKNGKEIYEGDILDISYQERENAKGTVVYNSDQIRFEVIDNIPDDEERYWDSIEVIGNIYENRNILV